MNNEKQCRVTGCNRFAKPNSVTGLCTRCYAFEHYWAGRTVGDKMKRLDQIDFWKKRGDQMLKPKGRKP